MMDCLSQKTQYTLLFCICIGSLLLRGSESLKCHSCMDSTCSKQTSTDCDPAMNICTESIVLLRTGSQSLTVRHKGCGTGTATMVLSKTSSDGLVSLLYKSGCNTDNCNLANTNTGMFPTEPPAVDPPENAAECYTCIDTDKSKCSVQNSQTVKCPTGQDRCYKATGFLIIDNSTLPVFIQKCSSSDCQSPNYANQWYDLSLNGSCCSEKNCNEYLEDTTTGTTGTTSTMTEIVTTHESTAVNSTEYESTNATTKSPVKMTTSGAVPSANSASWYSPLMFFAVSAILKF